RRRVRDRGGGRGARAADGGAGAEDVLAHLREAARRVPRLVRSRSQGDRAGGGRGARARHAGVGDPGVAVEQAADRRRAAEGRVMAKLIQIGTIVVGSLIVFGLIVMVLGLVGSALTIGGLAVTLLVRRDWVPLVYNVRSLGVRKWTSVLTAAGLALVVFVFAVVLMLTAGIQRTLRTTGSDD